MLVEMASRGSEQLPGIYQVDRLDFVKAKILGGSASPALWAPLPL